MNFKQLLLLFTIISCQCIHINWHIYQVSKPYAEFFSEASLESMLLKPAAPERPESPVGETAVVDMAVDAVDHGQPEDNNDGEDGGDENYDEDFGED